MKRSAQVGLLVMGALGVSAAGGAYISQREQACRADPANQADPDARCGRSSTSSGGHGWSYSGRSTTGTGGTTGRSGGTATLATTTVSRGGFGSTGHGLGGSGRS